MCAGSSARVPRVCRAAAEQQDDERAPSAPSPTCKSHPALRTADRLDQGPAGRQPAHARPDQGAAQAAARGFRGGRGNARRANTCTPRGVHHLSRD